MNEPSKEVASAQSHAYELPASPDGQENLGRYFQVVFDIALDLERQPLQQ